MITIHEHKLLCVGKGMEVASYMTEKALSITIIGSSEMPYQRTFGSEIGKITMMVSNLGGISMAMLEKKTLLKTVTWYATITVTSCGDELLFQILEEKGVTFYMNDSVTEIRGENKKVKNIKM